MITNETSHDVQTLVHPTYLNINMLLFLLEYTMAVLVWTKPEPGEGASPVKRRGVTLAVLTAIP